MEELRSYQVTEWDKPLQLRLRERPEPKGAEVLVKIEACGVCHSDVHIGEGYFEMGHDAKGTSVGVRGVVYPWIGCGHCAHCLRGHDVDCETPRSLGVRADGG